MCCLCSSDPSPKLIVVHHWSVSKDAIEKWRNLGFAPCKAVLKTLANTTQLASVVTDNQDVPQHHLVSHLLQLQHCWLKEEFATDLFHSDVTSIRKSTSFYIFCGKQSWTLFPYCKLCKALYLDCLLARTLHKHQNPWNSQVWWWSDFAFCTSEGLSQSACHSRKQVPTWESATESSRSCQWYC
jgi:hypothetical protein